MVLRKQIKSQDLVDFFKSLAVMLQSGITLNEALLSIFEEVKSKKFKRIIASLQKDVEAGRSFGRALTSHQRSFGNVCLSLVKAGEASGTLDENLVFLADWLERNNDLRKEIKAATLYPKIILGATMALGGTLAVFILPKLAPLFEQLRTELPLPTRILLSFSVFLKKFWFLVALGAIVLGVAFTALNRLKAVRSALHSFYLKLPFAGSFILHYQLALICQLFYTLFKSGLSISETLLITAQGATNLQYQKSILRIRQKVSQGTKLSKAMGGFSRFYPRNLINIIASGEKSGTLDKSFFYLTNFYLKEVKSKTKKLPTIIEPLLLMFIGLVVGFVALAIIMPIYGITKGIS